MIWDIQKGSYLPTFLELYINTDKDLDLNQFLKDEMGTFCHEWIHFLQDVTTGSGCNNSYVFFEHFLARGRKLVEDGVEFTPPVNVGNAFNVGINRECNGLAWGTTPSSCNFTQINSANVLHAKDISNITVHYQESQEFPVAIVTANNGEYFHVGMLVLMESMAHLCQGILCPGTASNHPIYPYHIAGLLAETLCPAFLNDPLNLIALCDVSLMSSAPGAYFVSYLKGISQNRIPMPTGPEDVYDQAYSYSDFLPKFYEIVHYACHHFLGILKDPQIFRFYRYWIKHTYLNAVRLRSKDRYFLLALLVPFCSNSFSPVSQNGTVLFIRHDQSPLHDWINALRINRFLNVRNLDPREPPIRITDVCPLLVDEMLNISELKTSSISDCQKLLALIEQSTQTVKNGMLKILVIDSLNSFLIKVLKQTLLFLDTLRDHGWTVIFVESRRTPYIKALRCEQEIVIEPSAECTGNEVICSAEIPLYGKIKKFYRINLLDGSEPILKESSYNRKSAGLLRPRPQLVMELKKLWRAGAKGKEIAERLQISESMVKKLKREYGLSQPRFRLYSDPSGNNYYGPIFIPPKPE